MKKTRFLSVFLLIVMAMSLWCAPQASALEDPDILAKAALLVDADTGAIAYAKNEHQQLYPASLTKIMTALLVLEAIEDGKLTLETEVTAQPSAFEDLSADGSSAGIKEGETLSVRNLLYCMMVVSANEACDILAEAVSGSVSSFVKEMNKRAAELGCKNTNFINPNGLHDSRHYTSAWDMYLITKEAMSHEMFMVIADTADIIIPATNKSGERHLYTTNHLLSSWRVIGYRNKEAHGIKTGSTDEAGHCLVSSASRGSYSYISVILGAERVEENGVGNIRSFSETTRMFDYAFDSFSYKTIVEKSEVLDKEVPVTLSTVDHVTVHPSKDIEVLFPNDLTPKDLERKLTLVESVEAPVREGQRLGTMELRYGDTVYGTVELLAMHDVEADSTMIFWRDVRLFFEKTSVRIGIAALVVLIVLLLIWRLVLSRRRYRYGRSVGHSYSRNYRGRRR